MLGDNNYQGSRVEERDQLYKNRSEEKTLAAEREFVYLIAGQAIQLKSDSAYPEIDLCTSD